MKEFLAKVVVVVIALSAPIHSVLLAVFGLAIADLVSGVVAAHRRGEPITSRKLRRTLGKLAVYEFAIVCAFVVETYLSGPSIPILKLISSLIGLTELKSVLENLDSISHGSFFKAIIDRISAPSNPKDK